MRVLQLLKTTESRWAFYQIRELVRLGVEVHVALPHGPMAADYEAAGATVHLEQFSLPVREPWRWPALFGELRELVKRIRPDVIHSHFVGTTLTMRLALGNGHPVPRLFQVPGPLHLEHAFFRRAEILTAGPPDYWIGACQWTCERYRRSGISEDRVFLGYYGINPEMAAQNNEPGKLRRELGVSERARLVGMVAYMYAPKRYLLQKRGIKGHEDLIDALALCLPEERDIYGVFVGGPWVKAAAYEKRIREYAERRLGDRARFLGTRNDVAEIYPDFDLAVHPSHSENLGGAPESLLRSVPTVTTTVGGFPDLIRPGDTGWLAPPRDPKRLSEAILQALGDPVRARAMAANGRELSQRLFDMQRTAHNVLGIYRLLASQGVS